MVNIFSYLNNFNYYGNPVVWAVVIILAVMYGFALRRHQILINLLALYIGILGAYWASDAIVIYRWALDKGWGLEYVSLLIFSLFWLIGLCVLWLSRLIRKVDYDHRFMWRWIQAIFNAIIHSGLVFSFIVNSSPENWQAYFSTWQLKLLVGPVPQMSWFVLSLAGLLVMRVKRRGPGRPSL